jgi:hypothetical protein
MKNAVINPHAMNAAMFGMIIPDRNVPNFWTAILVPLVFFFSGVSACAVTVALSVDAGRTDVRLRCRLDSMQYLDRCPDLGNHNPECEIRKSWMWNAHDRYLAVAQW